MFYLSAQSQIKTGIFFKSENSGKNTHNSEFNYLIYINMIAFQKFSIYTNNLAASILVFVVKQN